MSVHMAYMQCTTTPTGLQAMHYISRAANVDAVGRAVEQVRLSTSGTCLYCTKPWLGAWSGRVLGWRPKP